jgi:hypothetical protein
MRDPFLTESEHLMSVFDLTIAVDKATKERIRHKVWARVEENDHQPFSDLGIGDLISIGGLACGLLFSLGLAVFWSAGHAGLARLGSVAIAIIVFVCVALVMAQLGLATDVILSASAVYLAGSAIVVLAIRSLPLISTKWPLWISTGLRSGLVAWIIATCILVLGKIYELVFDWINPRSGLSQYPEAFIIKSLLKIISFLEELEDMRDARDRLIDETFARYKRGKILREQAGRTSAEIRESANVVQLKDGTFSEKYTLEVVREDGSTETLLTEEQTSATEAPFTENPRWAPIRKNLAHHVEQVALHIEHRLPEKLSVGEKRLDPWLKRELQARAQTIRNWAQRVALPNETSYEKLLTEVGTATVHAAEDHWSAIPKSEVVDDIGLRERLFSFCRKTVVGVIPLTIIVAAPAFKIAIPLAIRDSLLTFAVPWTLLQLIELVVPDASDYLSRSKGIREVLPASFGGISKG